MELFTVGDGSDPASPRPAVRSLPSGAREVGALSAVLVAVWTVWFMVAFVPWISGLSPWVDVASYASSFQSGPYLAWAVPCLLLALSFPAMAWAVHSAVAPERRFWSGLGVLFGGLYGGVLGAVYWLIVTVVPARIASGDLEGLAPLIVVSPHSAANYLEYLGYGLMGLALIFMGLAFTRGRWTTWIRALLVTSGVGGFLGFVFVMAQLPIPGMAALVVWAAALPAGCAVLVSYLLRGPPSVSAGDAAVRDRVHSAGTSRAY